LTVVFAMTPDGAVLARRRALDQLRVGAVVESLVVLLLARTDRRLRDSYQVGVDVRQSSLRQTRVPATLHR